MKCRALRVGALTLSFFVFFPAVGTCGLGIFQFGFDLGYLDASVDEHIIGLEVGFIGVSNIDVESRGWWVATDKTKIGAGVLYQYNAIGYDAGTAHNVLGRLEIDWPSRANGYIAMPFIGLMGGISHFSDDEDKYNYIPVLGTAGVRFFFADYGFYFEFSGGVSLKISEDLAESDEYYDPEEVAEPAPDSVATYILRMGFTMPF